jgi:hypothetical protein
MNLVERLQRIEAWVVWLRAELDREVYELVAVVASQRHAPGGIGAAWISAALAVRAGNQLVAERIGPLLAGLDEVGRQLRFAQAEALEASQ